MISFVCNGYQLQDSPVAKFGSEASPHSPNMTSVWDGQSELRHKPEEAEEREFIRASYWCSLSVVHPIFGILMEGMVELPGLQLTRTFKGERRLRILAAHITPPLQVQEQITVSSCNGMQYFALIELLKFP